MPGRERRKGGLTVVQARQRLRLSGGTELSFITAGEASRPAVLLLHGSPSSARMFREVIPELSQAAHVIAPDLPGFGESDVLALPSFPAFGQAISELLERLSIGPRYIYLHDYGAPVGFHIAMQAPERVLGLIVQNANAHRTGLGPQWDATDEPVPVSESVGVKIFRDLSVAFGVLSRRPSFTAAAIVTLALGANVAVFAAFRAVPIDEVPYKNAAELLMRMPWL
jgi:pimeloyl-ACP methyl ester carboxylesterase